MATNVSQKNTLTEQQQQFFKERVQFFQEKLNLNNWRIEVDTTKVSQKKVYAEVQISLEDHLAVIKFGTGWNDSNTTKHTISSVALHEVLHVFLKTYQIACVSRRGDWIVSEEHSLVVLLEKLLHEDTNIAGCSG